MHGLLAFFAMCYVANCWAGVQTEFSRLILDTSKHESSLTLKNLNAEHVLVQVWIDDGDPAGGPDKSNAPFVVLPPIFKMAPEELHTLRILYLPSDAPADRESLYWLNLLEIPPIPEQAPDSWSGVIMTMRTQLKVFLRPPALKAPPESAVGSMVWQLAKSGRGCSLSIVNPSPYHITLAYLDIENGDEVIPLPAVMLTPFESNHFELHACPDLSSEATVLFGVLDDSGSLQRHHVRVGFSQATVQVN